MNFVSLASTSFIVLSPFCIDTLSNETAVLENDISATTVSANPMRDELNEHGISTPVQPFIPQPEAPIDPGECRMRLLEHIEHFQNHIDARLTSIEAQVCGAY